MVPGPTMPSTIPLVQTYHAVFEWIPNKMCPDLEKTQMLSVSFAAPQNCESDFSALDQLSVVLVSCSGPQAVGILQASKQKTEKAEPAKDLMPRKALKPNSLLPGVHSLTPLET